MAREKELFRDNLVLLREKFGETDLIPLKQISEICEHSQRDIKIGQGYFPLKKVGRMYYVPIVGLASWLS